MVLCFVLCAAGCTDDRQVTADDVVFLFESAAAGTKVWRLPEPAQGYVDGVLTNYAKLDNAHAPMEALNGADALWEMDSANWRDSKKIKETLKTYAEFRKPENVDERGKLNDALRKAINDVPEIPGRQHLAERVVHTLGGVQDRSQVEDYPVAQGIEVLLNGVQEHADALDASTTGLRFTDAQVQAQIHEQYETVKQQITELQAQQLAIWMTFLEEQTALAKKLSPKAKDMSATMTDRADMEYRRQKLRLEHHEESVKNAEKRIKELKKALKLDDEVQAD